jgi:uncharacterized membrane protein YcaP (DUF421 family)
METVIRVVVIYLFLLAGLRILGKREFGQLSPFELVTLLLIPEMLTDALTRGDHSLTNAFIGIATLLSLVFLTSMLAHRSKKVADVVEGKPTVLVQHGQYVGDNMNVERITPAEIFTEMHKAGLERLEEVKWAILEDDGKIAIVPQDKSGRFIPKQQIDRDVAV